MRLRDASETLICNLAAIDALGVSVERLAVESTRLGGKPVEELRAMSDDLAGRVSYLLEAIAPIEVDSDSCTIQMRSVPPYRAENATSYYEVLVTQSAISLLRYKKGRGEARIAEPFAITREVLYRLVSDFLAVISQA